MMWEIAVVGTLIVLICVSRGMIDGNKFVQDNSAVFKLLKEFEPKESEEKFKALLTISV